MTAAEVADLLALPKSMVYELARRGELPCARLGRTVRFLRDDIERRNLAADVRPAGGCGHRVRVAIASIASDALAMTQSSRA